MNKRLFVFAILSILLLGCKKKIHQFTLQCIDINTGHGIEGIELYKVGFIPVEESKREYYYTDQEGKFYANTLRNIKGTVLIINDLSGFLLAEAYENKECPLNPEIIIDSEFKLLPLVKLKVLNVGFKSSSKKDQIQITVDNKDKCIPPILLSFDIENQEADHGVYSNNGKLNFRLGPNDNEINVTVLRYIDSLKTYSDKTIELTLPPLKEDTTFIEINLDQI